MSKWASNWVVGQFEFCPLVSRSRKVKVTYYRELASRENLRTDWLVKDAREAARVALRGILKDGECGGMRLIVGRGKTQSENLRSRPRKARARPELQRLHSQEWLCHYSAQLGCKTRRKSPRARPTSVLPCASRRAGGRPGLQGPHSQEWLCHLAA